MSKITFLDFSINGQGEISRAFLEKRISRFSEAADFIQKLPYRRNENKNNLLTVFSDGYGVCSTKHALLKQLANENHQRAIDLVVGIYRMSAENTPRIKKTLTSHKLEYIPEAHCYLKHRNVILDVTRAGSSEKDFNNDLLEEHMIQPHQIGPHKVHLHKKFLEKWLEENSQVNYSLEELWEIRERCIGDLSSL